VLSSFGLLINVAATLAAALFAVDYAK